MSFVQMSCPTPVPIAVLGMAFHFSGGAKDEDSFWNILLEGRSTADTVPKARFSAPEFYHQDTNRLDTLPNTKGHFLQDDIAAFDAPFFSITPAEAAAMDPQSRALLELSYQALENAGIPLAKCTGTDTSVYIGCSADDYRLIYAKDPERPIRYAATGMARGMLANKISWYYNLKGPSLTVDTACSSSLNAVHLACQSLQAGESRMALVGGSQLFFTPDSMAPLAHLNFFSPDGECFSFDERANGYSRGEGHGILVLKLLPDAIRDRDRIRAVIRATGSNENGRTPGGITKVDVKAQERLIRKTYASADLELCQTRFVEAHGPGTSGDVIECAGLASVFSKFRSHEEPLYVSSVKANLGHLEGGSGIPSLVKTILSLERGVIPKLANFRHLHPDIANKSYPFSFPTENIPWPNGLRRASVNSFGFGGSNAHVVMEDALSHIADIQNTILPRSVSSSPSTKHASLKFQNDNPASDSAAVGRLCDMRQYLSSNSNDGRTCVIQSSRTLASYLLLFSSADEQGITRLSRAYESRFQDQSIGKSVQKDALLRDLSYTLSMHRTQLSWRSFAVASSWTGILPLLQSLRAGIRAFSHPNIAFVFTGQGAQWPRMGVLLKCYPTFTDSLKRCQLIFKKLGASWNLLEELELPSKSSRIDSPDLSQPICTAIQISLVDLLRGFNVKPQAVVGHSSGEIAAAYCAGALSQHDACRLAFFRGVLSRKVQDTQTVECGMMAVGLDFNGATTYIEKLSQTFAPVQVYIACQNAPSSVTIAGSKVQLRCLEEIFKRKSVFARILRIPVAYHSPFMETVATEYREKIVDLGVGISSTTGTTFFSSLHGKAVKKKELHDKEYWVANLTGPVLFSDAVTDLCMKAPKDGFQGFVEIGPHTTLQPAVEEIFKAITQSTRSRNRPTVPLYRSALNRNHDDLSHFLNLIGSLHCLGVSVKVDAEQCYEDTRLFPNLPYYPFDHSRRYWHESRLSKSFRYRKFPRSDFLGTRVPDWNPYNARWRHTFRTLENPWIEDHRIGGGLLLPGAGSLVMAIEAAAQYDREFDPTPVTGFRFRDVSFLKSLNLTLGPEGTEIELILRPLKDKGDRRAKWSAFNIYLFENDEWAEVCNGQICLDLEESMNPVNGQREVRLQNQRVQDECCAISDRCTREVNIDHLYRRLQHYGLELGQSFKAFTNVRGNMLRETVIDISLRQWTCRKPVEQTSPFYIHPATLDNILQAGVTALSNCGSDDLPTMVPTRIRDLWISAKGLDGSVDSHITAYARSEYRGYRESNMHVVALSTDSQTPLIKVSGLQTTIIESQKVIDTREEKLCWSLQWKHLSKADTFKCSRVTGTYPSVKIITQEETRKSEILSQIKDIFENRGIQFGTVSTLSQISMNAPDTDQDVLIFLELKQSFLEAINEDEFEAFKRLMINAKHVLWICLKTTSALRRISGEIDGLARALRSEYENLRFITLRFEESPDLVENIAGAVLLNISSDGPLHPLRRYEPEQVVMQDGTLYVSRLEEDKYMNELLKEQDQPMEHRKQPFGAVSNLKLGIGTPGALDTFHFEEDLRSHHDPAADEIEVRPIYAGLNFMDCLTALGQIPQAVLGVECSGVVLRAGCRSDLPPGTRVMLCTDGTFVSRTRCHYQNAIRIPDEMPLEVAGGLLGAGGTAYHALCNIARLQAGESILIHAGAGATGQMAIQIANHIGAKVYVTVGSHKKADLVKNLFGIPEDNILYSRNTNFAEAIDRITHGRGVDVVLNSLAGDSLSASWRCIAPFGRFVEIGKKDIYQNKQLSMFPFAKNASFAAIDLAGIWQERPWLMRKIAEELLSLWKAGKVKIPCPLQVFEIGEVEEAFRVTQSGKAAGKIVLRMDPECIVPTYLRKQPRYKLCPDSTYLVSGGFGGLGITAARWMVSRGVRHLILLSRSGSMTNEAQDLIAEFASNGVQAIAPSCDVTDHDMVRDCLRECSLHMPPIKGCIQAAAVIKDTLFRNMTFDEWCECVEPKSTGSWNLHMLLPKDMSFFIFLSSIGGVVGGRGQANYAAGNSFQDALAQYRVSNGMNATSLDLGMIPTAGILAKNPKLLQHLDSLGFYIPMTENHFHILLDYYCSPDFDVSSRTSNVQLVCGIAQSSLIRSRGKMLPTWMNQPLFEAFLSTGVGKTNDLEYTINSEYRTVLANSPTPADAAAVLSNALIGRLARSLGMPAEDIDPSRPLHFYGVDSLVAVELRNWYWKVLQADIALFEILGNRGCDSLSLLAVLKSNFRNIAWTVGNQEVEVT